MLVVYQKRLFKRDAATIRVKPSAATNMDEIILGLIVMHRDGIKRWRLRAVLATFCLRFFLRGAVVCC